LDEQIYLKLQAIHPKINGKVYSEFRVTAPISYVSQLQLSEGDLLACQIKGNKLTYSKVGEN
jgi:hypothetical protein